MGTYEILERDSEVLSGNYVISMVMWHHFYLHI